MSSTPKLDRRAFVRRAGLLCAGMWVAPALALSEAELFPVATTRYGKVKGISWSGVHAFKGVPYGASTAGKNRWRAPRPPTSWKGERECFDYGVISPQVTTDRRSEYSSLIMWDRHVGGMGEDMLTLNVWSRVAQADGGKRPVLVSFHGGGYTTGSGNAPGYDGDPLVRFEDVVVVTVNHRLGALGYLNLVDVGASTEFADAGCAGPARPRGLAQMGAGEHRELRRRSHARVHLRSVRRRREDLGDLLDAGGEGLVQSRCRAIRLGVARAGTRHCCEGRAGTDERTGREQSGAAPRSAVDETHRRATDRAVAGIRVLAGGGRKARRSAVIHSTRMPRRARRMCR